MLCCPLDWLSRDAAALPPMSGPLVVSTVHYRSQNLKLKTQSINQKRKRKRSLFSRLTLDHGGRTNLLAQDEIEKYNAVYEHSSSPFIKVPDADYIITRTACFIISPSN